MAYKTKKAFSLVETLIAMLIIGVVFALAIPFMTKTLANKDKLNKGSAGFYFKQADRDKAINKCFSLIDTADKKNRNKEFTVIGSTDCQEYEFVVPKDVHYIDLTLVAGGGGGGGASGGIEYEEQMPVLPYPADLAKKISGSETPDDSFPTMSRISLYDTFYKYVFKVMVGNGENGKSSNPTNKTTGTGGHSGYAIADYVINREEFFKTVFANSFNKTKREQIKATQLLPGVVMYLNGQFFINYLWKEDTGDKLGWRRFRINEYRDNSIGCHLYGKIHIKDAECLLYEINTPSGDYITSDNKEELVCRYQMNDGTTSEIKENNCYNSIPTVNQILRQSGMEGTKVTTSSNTEHNAHYQGARGGYISDEITAGQGGQGGDLIIDVNEFKKSEFKKSDGKLGQEGAAEVFQHSIYPGTVASGGVGGAAVKLKNFPVVPGKKYKIYVGNGGAGGAQGEQGYAESKASFTTTTSAITNTKHENDIIYTVKLKQPEKNGTRGQGGTSTAIFDENDRLVLLVMGGAGGHEGIAPVINKDKNDRDQNKTQGTKGTSLPTKHDIIPEEPLATRHYPIVYIRQNDDILQKYLDPTYEIESTSLRDPDSNTTTSHLNAVAKVVINKYKDNNKEIIKLFTLNDSTLYNSTETPINDDDKTGSFLAYDRKTTTDNAKNNPLYVQVYANSNSINTTSYKAYHGFYLRYVDNFDYMYAGGLGGFSGLGTKAGCGGGFVGNRDGDIYTTITEGENKPVVEQKYAPDLQGTFIAQEKVYYVKDYFDNCTLNSPNGQSAEFIPPSISLIDGELLGQAGAGGGGGGWSTKYGAGKGGDGQAGYVFITWKKF